MLILSNRSKSSNIRPIIVDIFVITFIYFISYYVKTNSLKMQMNYLTLYGLTALYWVTLSIYHKKHSHYFNKSRLLYWRSTLWVGGSSIFFITLTLSITGIINVSRLFLLQTIFLLLLIELLMGFLIPRETSSDHIGKSVESKKKSSKDLVRIRHVVPSAIWLLVTFFTMVWVKTSHIYYYNGFEKILLLLYGSWTLSIIITYKYSQSNRQNIYYYITPYLKAGILMLLFVSIFYYFFRLEPLSRFLLFGTAIVHSSLEVVAFTFIYLIKNVDVPGQSFVSALEKYSTAQGPLPIEKKESVYSPKLSLEEILIGVSPYSWGLLKQLFPLDILNRKFVKSELLILSTQSVFNIEVQAANASQMIINMEKLNNMRRLNKYFLSAHGKIKAGAWLVGNYTALEDDWHRLQSKIPKLVFSILYPAYFVIHRVFPKLPYLKNLYFLVTKGRNRKISRAEVLGRLTYCGYQIINESVQNSSSYFIAQKVHHPSVEQNPSYSPIVRLKRIGYQGELITIYKLRTMHPYSEFIQKEVFKQNDLNESGKLKNDFRLTKWGKIFRKMWIDELPQLLNWLRGDVAIVGVRALSEHYFSLYPANLQNLRIQFKPGLVPPYYADLPENFEQILESERNYLLQKQQNPIKTDIKYFLKALYNILIKGARSS
jgi:lipopolysaccharide/colanic/teichoic acid biosynthesis glycosyltransferase